MVAKAALTLNLACLSNLYRYRILMVVKNRILQQLTWFSVVWSESKHLDKALPRFLAALGMTKVRPWAESDERLEYLGLGN